MAPPARLRVDRATSGGDTRVGLGPNGLRLDTVGDVDAASPWHSVAMVTAGPGACAGLDAAQVGALAVVWSPGIVRTVRMNDTGQLFDRRPPGVDRAVGAASANAALVHDDSGWRAVVLPSLGDRVPSLGDGPVAIAPHGRVVAAADQTGVTLISMADGQGIERHETGEVDAVAIGHDDRVWVARGAAIGAVDVPRGDGGAITMLRAAGDANVVVGVGASGAMHVVGDVQATWDAPCPVVAASVSADGRWVLLTSSDHVVVCDVRDGAVALRVHGVSCGALLAQHQVVVGGDWGIAVIAPPDDSGS